MAAHPTATRRQNGPKKRRYCCGNGEAEGPEVDGALCDGNF